MLHRTRWWLGVAGLLLFAGSTLAVACGGPHSSTAPENDAAVAPAPGVTSPPPARSSSLGVSAPTNLHAIVARVRRAFRAKGDLWTSEHDRFDATAGADGLTLVALGGERLALGPTTAVRGAAPLATKAITWTSAGAGGLEADRGGLVETLQDEEAGLEQSWTFRAAPPGTGDLVVRVPVSAFATSEARPDGLHLRGGNGRGGFVYGAATWVDARGTRTTVAPVMASGGIELRVPEAVIARSGYPATLDPTVAPEQGLGTPVTGLPAENSWAESPSLAFDGTNYLVVWEDERNGYSVYAARVAPGGAVLDPLGIVVLAGTYIYGPPVVAFDGTQYFVVWATFFSGVEGAHVTTSGLVSAPSIQIALGVVGNTYVQAQNPAVVYDASSQQYLVVWQDFRNGYAADDLYASRVTLAGSALDISGFPIATTPGNKLSPSIAASNGTFFVVWEDGRKVAEDAGTDTDIYGATVGPHGEVTTNIPVCTAPNNQTNPQATSGSGTFFASWVDGRNDIIDDVYAARVAASGTVTDPDGIDLGPIDDTLLCNGFDGTNFVDAWQSGGNLVAGRVSAGGSVLDATPRTLASTSGNACALAFGATGGELTYDGFGGLYAFELDLETGPVSTSPVLVAQSSNAQHNPQVAFDGTNFLVVWRDGRNGANSSFDTYAARVNTSGQVIDANPISLGSSCSYSTYNLTFGGGVYYYQACGEAWWITPSGAVSFAPVLITPKYVFFDGTNFLLLGQNGNSIIGIHLTPNGTQVESSPFTVTSTATYSNWYADFGASYAVVAWPDLRLPIDAGPGYDYYPNSLYVAAVAPNGTIVGTPGGTPISTVTGNALNQLQFNHSTFDLSWIEYYTYEVPNPLPADAGPDADAGLSTDNSFNYLHRLITPPLTLGPIDSNNMSQYEATGYDGIAELGLTSGGGSGSESSIAVYGQGNGTSFPGWNAALASDPVSHNSLIALEDFDPTLGAVVVKIRLASEQGNQPLGYACSSSTDCASGFCTGAAAGGNVCCASACSDGCDSCNAAGSCVVTPKGTLCGPNYGAGQCIEPSYCDGVSNACPMSVTLPNGTPCATGVCENGGCVVPPPPPDAGGDAATDAGAGGTDAEEESSGPDGSRSSDSGLAGDATLFVDASVDASIDASVNGEDASADDDAADAIIVEDATPPPPAEGHPAPGSLDNTGGSGSGGGCSVAPGLRSEPRAGWVLLAVAAIASAARGRRRWAGIAAVAAGSAAAISAAGCSGKNNPGPGELMVAIETDMSLPKDVDRVHMDITAEGNSLLSQDYPVGPDGVKIPATIGVVGGSNPSTAVTIRVIAYQQGTPRVLRQNVTTVPTSRIATLRMPIQWLCVGSAQELTPGQVTSICPDGQTCVEGTCQTDVIDSSTLPDYSAQDVYGGGNGGGNGECFDTIGCWEGAVEVMVDPDTCTIPLPANPSNANVFLRTTTSGICSSDGTLCLIPLDGNTANGWYPVATNEGPRIQLPRAVCNDLGNMVTEVEVSTTCATKSESVPTCGPWSSTGDGDGGTVDVTAPPPPDAAPEAGPDATVDANPPDVNSPETPSPCTDSVRGCGGLCPPCPRKGACNVAQDCLSQVCTAGACDCSADQMHVPSNGTAADYCVDNFEVTDAKYIAFLSAGLPDAGAVSPTPSQCAWNTSFVPASGMPAQDNYPVVYVNWCDAYAFCAATNRRLCGQIGGGSTPVGSFNDPTIDQWQGACSNQSSRAYPYGSTFSATTCNGLGYSGSSALLAVGEAYTCVGGFPPMRDMSGNASEWEDSCATSTGASDVCRARGGSFTSSQPQLLCAADLEYPRNLTDATLGFRCCTD